MTLADKLSIAFPDAKYSSVGDEIEWSKENSYSMPTEDEINAKFQASQYQRDRLAEYPSIQKCIHAILDDDLTALQAKRKLIKEKYPKPE
jgi:hypothetical protein